MWGQAPPLCQTARLGWLAIPFAGAACIHRPSSVSQSSFR
jgi:hypothetical protein